MPAPATRNHRQSHNQITKTALPTCKAQVRSGTGQNGQINAFAEHHAATQRSLKCITITPTAEISGFGVTSRFSTPGAKIHISVAVSTQSHDIAEVIDQDSCASCQPGAGHCRCASAKGVLFVQGARPVIGKMFNGKARNCRRIFAGDNPFRTRAQALQGNARLAVRWDSTACCPAAPEATVCEVHMAASDGFGPSVSM
ncbi:MAG: hypothetical protein GDA36_03915 [Rhodobacteraceae bacterium]|nr:hypothetical protein [Paracoccaceae bacterium]